MPRSRALVSLTAAPLSLIPSLRIDYAQLGRFGSHPFRLRVRATDTAASFRVLDERLAIPHKAADIQCILQDTVGSLSATADR